MNRSLQTCQLLLSILLLIGIGIPAYSTIIYVNANSPCSTNCDGTSWGLGYKDLQLALTASGANDTIWVAAGRYIPSVSNRSISFNFTEGEKIFGGFAGTETALSQRDFLTNLSVLSGDRLNNDNANVDTSEATRDDNSIHVIELTTALTAATILDGFLIRDGHACDPAALTDGYEGGGLRIVNNAGNPTIRNCTFAYNLANFGGGAMHIRGNPIIENCKFHQNVAQAFSNGGGAVKCGSTSAPVFRDCTFEYNLASINGSAGAFYVQNSSQPQLFNCLFANNNTTGTNTEGGAVYIVSASNAAHATFTNCIFTANTATFGGAVNMWGSMADFYNCTFYGNSSDALYVGAGGTPTTRPRAYNSIFYNNGGNENNNATVKPDYFSCLLESATCIGNSCNCSQFSLNPLFVNPAANDFNLQNLSPATNTGDNAHVTESFDFSGNDRIFFSIVDLGAVESGQALNAEMLVADSTSMVEIYDNSDPAEFVGTAVGDTITKIFKLDNSGSATLMLCGWTITGDFSYTRPADSVLLVGDPFTTITIRAHASALGTSTGVLTIGNNDVNESTFEINLRQTIQLPKTEEGAELVIYEGLSPNGDGKNDYLRIENISQYPDNKVYIYDRTGKLVAQYSGYENETNCWRGEYQQGNKKRMVNGTYYYVLRVKEGAEPKKGFLTLQ